MKNTLIITVVILIAVTASGLRIHQKHNEPSIDIVQHGERVDATRTPVVDDKSVSANGTNRPPVKLTVFYETLCPDSMRFFTQQLGALFDNNLGLSSYIDFDFVPFGNAQQTFDGKEWKFTCQHGPKECEYNKLHACIVGALAAVNDPQQTQRLVPFLICLMSSADEDSTLPQCAARFDVPMDGLRHCQSGKAGNKLLSLFGNRTQKQVPPITFVPTIVFNGVYSEKNQNVAQSNLPKAICHNLHPKPYVCNSIRIYNAQL